MRTRLLAVPALALTLAACGSSERQPAHDAAAEMPQGAEQVQQAAGELAQGVQSSPQQTAQGVRQMAQGSVEPVDFEQLKASLPDVDGWTMGDARGEQVNMPVAISRAGAQYRRDDSRVELEIVDSALSQLLLAPMSMFLSSGYSERSDHGFKRATKVGGYPGLEDWNLRTRRGEVTAVVANRFIVKATGHDVENLDLVHAIVGAVDLQRLAALE